jgi:hypothetical protein
VTAEPDRLPNSAMPGLLRPPNPQIPLGVYAHYKGDFYYVVGGTYAAAPARGQVEVQYISIVHGYTAHRPVEDFLAGVPDPDSPGATRPRFRLVRAFSPAECFVRMAAIAIDNVMEGESPPSAPSGPQAGG